MIACPQCSQVDSLETMELEDGYLVFCTACGFDAEELLYFPFIEIEIVQVFEMGSSGLRVIEVARLREGKE